MRSRRRPSSCSARSAGVPAVLVRGLRLADDGEGAVSGLIPAARDLFR